MSRRQFWGKAHLYAGTLLILPLLVIALTGILLGFYDQLRYGQVPYRLDQPIMAPLAPAVLASRAQAAYPDAALEILYLPNEPQRAARAKLVRQGNAWIAFIDPASARILAMKSAGEEDWLDFLYHLHHGQILGLTGQIIASTTGAFILLLWLAGLWLWWSRRGRPRSWTGRSVRIKAMSLHRWLGLWAGGLVSVLAVAGALLNFAGPLIQHFDPPPKLAVARARDVAPSLERQVTLVRHAYPHAALERIYFPRSEAPMRFRFRDGGWVFMDGRTGAVLKIKSPAAHWTNLLFPFHSGRIFGRYGPPLVSVLGFFLLVLSVSGLLRWR